VNAVTAALLIIKDGDRKIRSKDMKSKRAYKRRVRKEKHAGVSE